MSVPQPVFQHPFRVMCAELLEAVEQLEVDGESIDGEGGLGTDDAGADCRVVAEKVRRVAYALRALANALDITQGNSDANGYPQWGQDIALRTALGQLAEMVCAATTEKEAP